jgi:hypothetical protein
MSSTATSPETSPETSPMEVFQIYSKYFINGWGKLQASIMTKRISGKHPSTHLSFGL